MTNALAEALEQAEAPKHVQCQTCKVVATLKPEEYVTFRNAISGGVPLQQITRALRSLGHTLGDESLNRHIQNGHSV